MHQLHCDFKIAGIVVIDVIEFVKKNKNNSTVCNPLKTFPVAIIITTTAPILYNSKLNNANVDAQEVIYKNYDTY